MKKVIFTGILLLTLAAAWVLYLEYEMERFEESLPKPPTVDAEDRGGHLHLHDEKEEHVSQASPVVAETETAAVNEEIVDDSESAAALEGLFESEEPSAAIALEEPSNETGTDEMAGTDVPVSQSLVYVHGEHCQPTGDPQFFVGRLPDEILEKMERSLIARFGNIPAVQIYMKHHRESADRGWTSDEMIEYHLARLELFPHLKSEIEEAIQRTEANRKNPPTGPPLYVD